MYVYNFIPSVYIPSHMIINTIHTNYNFECVFMCVYVYVCVVVIWSVCVVCMNAFLYGYVCGVV